MSPRGWAGCPPHMAWGAIVPLQRPAWSKDAGPLQHLSGGFPISEASIPNIVTGQFPELQRVRLEFHWVPKCCFQTSKHNGECFFLIWPGPLGSLQKSPGIEAEYLSQLQLNPTFLYLLRVMSCFCKLHTILGHVVHYGAKLVTYRGDEMEPHLLWYISSSIWNSIVEKIWGGMGTAQSTSPVFSLLISYIPSPPTKSNQQGVRTPLSVGRTKAPKCVLKVTSGKGEGGIQPRFMIYLVHLVDPKHNGYQQLLNFSQADGVHWWDAGE